MVADEAEPSMHLHARFLSTGYHKGEVARKSTKQSPEQPAGMVSPQLRGCAKGHCEEQSDEAIPCRWPFDSGNGMNRAPLRGAPLIATWREARHSQ